MTATRILPGTAEGPVAAMDQGLSFWGGVDPETARVIDIHHPAHGTDLAGSVLLMPTTRGSCSGSGVILDMLIRGNAPAAVIFSEPEDTLTLGGLIGAEMFGTCLPVLRVAAADLARLSDEARLTITDDAIIGERVNIPAAPLPDGALTLTGDDCAILAGRDGEAAALAMRIVCAMARNQGAAGLIDISRGHVDGCILAHSANLIFAERMAQLGARVRVPTTINAISVDRRNWRAQGVPPLFGDQASRLADAYTRMGCQPSFTCAPYLLEGPPVRGEDIAWSESNAVIYANSVLGARTQKHPDYLDLCIAVTGRAPLAGVYLDEGRGAARVLDFDLPDACDDAIWPLVGYLSGLASPDRIPLLRGLAAQAPTADDLKALCAAFGTTSAAPMLHVEGVTPEAAGAALNDADLRHIGPADFARAWHDLNRGPGQVDLIAIGSPHASAMECRSLARLLAGRSVRIATIVTTGRGTIAELTDDGTMAFLTTAGVQIVPDLCWCSITEPVFPPATRTVMTNSGKYAHYGPGLSGRALRFGSLSDCVEAAVTGHAPAGRPVWLARHIADI
ncbi:aconitase X [Paracoccus marinaquae]|uniref:DUF521 domain-containing protein n=1 Tax=Paracoccus marinaquae TaxID=2841926 RepID=A0ABS6AM72_9RHOB|nr:aconitase X [Paracoccus marinaquae]MBU3030759.1 DUF521 domain-containing protein [Paracoccus marinaquae]